MQNKRGISQALSPKASRLDLRKGSVFDVFVVQAFLSSTTESIAQTSDRLLSDCSDLTAQGIHAWLRSDRLIWLAVTPSQIVGLAVATPDGEITALLVSKDLTSGDCDAVLLSKLVAELDGAGCSTARVRCSDQAIGFFVSNGWINAGPSNKGFTRLEKVLTPLP